MNIDNIPNEVWLDLMDYFETIKNKNLILFERSTLMEKRIACVADYFYHGIYTTWAKTHPGEGAVEYTYNGTDNIDNIASNWSIEQKEAITRQDTYYPKQTQGESIMSLDLTLIERYGRVSARGIRLQFLVNQGGGIVLFNRMRRACQEYRVSCRTQQKRSVVQSWKVFGEMFYQQGRSDACVIYFDCQPNDPELNRFMENYLKPNTHDLVNKSFQPIGLVQYRSDGYWFATQPDRSKWLSRFAFMGNGNENEAYRGTSSAGYVMGLILAYAVVNTNIELKSGNVRGTRTVGKLLTLAKTKAKYLVNHLQLDITPLMTQRDCEQNQRAVEMAINQSQALVNLTSGTLSRGSRINKPDIEETRL